MVARSKCLSVQLMKFVFCHFFVLQLSGCATETLVIQHGRGTGSHYTTAPYDMEYSLWAYTFLSAKEYKVDSLPLKQGEVIGFTQQDVDTVVAVAGTYQKQLPDRWYIWFRPATSKEKRLQNFMSIFKGLK